MQTLSRKKLLPLIALLISSFWYSVAQNGSQGSLSGTITDPGGAAIAGAAITITNEANNQVRTTQTNRDGFYDVEALDPGSYTVQVEAQGFETSVTKGEALDPGQRRRSSASLKLGSTTQQVTVQGSELEVQTQSSESGGTITAKQMSNIMLNGRNFQVL